MKKLNYRRIISTLSLAILFALHTVVPINAHAIAEDNVVTFSQNEYVQMLEEYNKLTEDLKTFSVNDVSSVKVLESLKENLDNYPKHIRSLQAYTDDELRTFNYSDDQIFAIRNYDGSQKMTIAAAATVSGSTWLSSHSYNSSTNKTTVTVNTTVYWSGVPSVQQSDLLGIAVKGSAADFILTSSYCYVVYPNGTSSYTNAHSTTYGLERDHYVPTNNGTYNNIFTSASMSYTAVAQGNITVYGYGSAYAHCTIAGTSGFSLSVSGIGITFSATYGYSIMYNYYNSHY